MIWSKSLDHDLTLPHAEGCQMVSTALVSPQKAADYNSPPRTTLSLYLMQLLGDHWCFCAPLYFRTEGTLLCEIIHEQLVT